MQTRHLLDCFMSNITTTSKLVFMHDQEPIWFGQKVHGKIVPVIHRQLHNQLKFGESTLRIKIFKDLQILF